MSVFPDPEQTPVDNVDAVDLPHTDPNLPELDDADVPAVAGDATPDEAAGDWSGADVETADDTTDGGAA